VQTLHKIEAAQQRAGDAKTPSQFRQAARDSFAATEGLTSEEHYAAKNVLFETATVCDVRQGVAVEITLQILTDVGRLMLDAPWPVAA
jgi:hypothetical protein